MRQDINTDGLEKSKFKMPSLDEVAEEVLSGPPRNFWLSYDVQYSDRTDWKNVLINVDQDSYEKGRLEFRLLCSLQEVVVGARSCAVGSLVVHCQEKDVPLCKIAGRVSRTLNSITGKGVSFKNGDFVSYASKDDPETRAAAYMAVRF